MARSIPATDRNNPRIITGATAPKLPLPLTHLKGCRSASGFLKPAKIGKQLSTD
ncbi:MAG: hypothetical protein WC749_16260 [Dehalococcoidia bacterium]